MLELDSPLISCERLQSHLNQPDLHVLDASVPPVVPGFESVNKDGFFAVIPGARRFDYDREVCKPNSSLPHMMPSANLFQEKVRQLGINRNSQLVVYDDVGLYASPRAWWMFRAMGHERVAVLEGGLPAWIEAGYETEAAYQPVLAEGDFLASEQPSLFCDFTTVLAALEDPGHVVLDARSAARFAGQAPEPRPQVRRGHMPNAQNLPFPQLLDGGKLRSAEDLRSEFAHFLSTEQTLISSCGSGITACILTLAAAVAGHDKLSVYDGSWAEWGLPGKLPVVTD